MGTAFEKTFGKGRVLQRGRKSSHAVPTLCLFYWEDAAMSPKNNKTCKRHQEAEAVVLPSKPWVISIGSVRAFSLNFANNSPNTQGV
jgi:hypothetical protein